MPDPTPTGEQAEAPPNATEYEQFASYEDGDAMVICHRREPDAWIRSDAVVAVRR